MKTFYAVLCLAIASLTQLQAQAPQGFNYQATVRNSEGNLVVNSYVYFKFNVVQGSLTAVPIFTETHFVSTDDLGQVSLVIGEGTANTGAFSQLDWSLGSYYLGIELSINGANNYVAMGTTQLLSVPYALYAENSGNSTPTTPNLETVLVENNSANNQQIKDLQDPTDAQDAVTKNYTYSKAEVDALLANLQSQIDNLDSTTVTDIDGNTYNYLTYGDQVWTVDNAAMVTYRDGTPIPQQSFDTDWSNLTTGAWAYYDNDPTKPKLYNWYAVMGIHDNDPNTPNKEFSPEGWHVPSDAEWTTLEEHLIANDYNYDGTTTGNKIAKAMASTTGWNSSTEIGAPGNDQSANNDSAFNAYPLGYRGYWEQGSFVNNGNQALFWSSSSFNDVLGWYFRLSFQFEFSDLTMDDSIWKQGGMQVRFVRDGEVNSNAQVNPINDVVVCSGIDVSPVNFSTTNTQGTTEYSWIFDNVSTGIQVSGSGDYFSPGSFPNTTSEPQVSTVTVTPELTFQGQTTTGPSETFTVTVYPSGQVNQVEDIIVNSGEIINEIIFSTSNTSGATTYSWTNSHANLGLSSSGSGNIPSFNAINSSTTPIFGTITVTPALSSSIDCLGPSISFTITVNPAAGGTGTVTDQDGNTYDYLTYGDQVWTVENAEMVTYIDGTPIPQVTADTEWESLTTGAWCYQNNDETKGKLYNWYAVMGIHEAASISNPSLRKEFSPEGWHVPRDAEWTTLAEYLITNGLNNSSGFNAFNAHGGYRNVGGSFNWEYGFGFFWSSTEYNTGNAWYRILSSTHGPTNGNGNYYDKRNGFSVRFVRD